MPPLSSYFVVTLMVSVGFITHLQAVDIADFPASVAPASQLVAECRAAHYRPFKSLKWLSSDIGFLTDNAVILNGVRWVDDGPEEGLALIACLNSGKIHESLIRLDSDDAALLKTAFILAFGWPDGETNDPVQALPPRGIPVRVMWEWQDDDNLQTRRIDVSCLVRDRKTDRPFPPLPFIYTGSRIGTQRLRDQQGQERIVPSFKLAEHRTLAALFDENDALLSTPLPFLNNDIRLEVNTKIAPPAKSTGRLIIFPATVPLSLWSNNDGELSLTAGGAILNDEEIVSQIQRCYSINDGDILRAVAINVPKGLPRIDDNRCIKRLTGLAHTASCWVVPIIAPIIP